MDNRVNLKIIYGLHLLCFSTQIHFYEIKLNDFFQEFKNCLKC